MSISIAKEGSIFYNPYYNFGFYDPYPLGNLVNLVLNLTMLAYPGILFGLSIGIKIFIITTSIIYGLSFYIFTSTFTNKYSARLFGTIFFLFNPFSLQLYAQGDFSPFVFYSLVLIGATFLNKGIKTNKLFHPYYLISAFLIVLSFVMQQSFVPALLFYLVILFYSVLFNLRNLTIRKKMLKFLKSFVSIYLSIIFIGMMFILPLLYAPSSFLPGSLNSLTLGAYINSGLKLSQVLILKAYYPYLAWFIIHQFYGNSLYYIWIFLEIVTIFLIIFGYLITLKREVLFFSSIALVISPFAAETHGIFLNIDIYLFNNIPGFQATNYPYLWVWFIIMPIYSIIATLILSEIGFVRDKRKPPTNVILKQNTIGNFHHKLKKKISALRRYVIYLFFIVAIIMIVTPITTQGYYGNYDSGNTGMRQMVLPSWEYSLDNTLVNLTKENNSGVLFNDYNIMQTYLQFKTAIISTYIPHYSTTSNFFVWLYNLLNSNGTRYSANLVSILGVKYFVLFTNVSANGNPYYVPQSAFLNQIGWTPIIRSENYTIFRNQYYSGGAYYPSNYTLALGNYNMLNELAYLGVNLSKTPIFFPTDINNSNYVQVFRQTNMIALSNENEITGLVLSISNSTPIYPVNYIPGQYGNPSEHWINSERVQNYPFLDTLTPFAETSGPNNFLIPLNVREPGEYDIFIKVAFTNGLVTHGGELNLILNGNSIGNIDTSGSFHNTTNRFMWINFTANLLEKNTLSLQSVMGFNAISQIRVISNNNFKYATQTVDHFLSKETNHIVEFYNPIQRSIGGNDHVAYGINIGGSTPGGKYLYVNSTNSNVSLDFNVPFKFSGSIYIRTLSLSTSRMDISYSNHDFLLGYTTPATLLKEAVGYHSFLFNAKNITSFKIVSTGGVNYLGIVALIGSNITTLPSNLNSFLFENYSVLKNNSITNFNLDKKTYKNHTILVGNFTYYDIRGGDPLSIYIPLIMKCGTIPVFFAKVNGPGIFSVDGGIIQDKNISNTLVILANNSFVKNPKSYLRIQFVPDFYNSTISYNISFNITLYGFAYFPVNIVRYNTDNAQGRDISYSFKGYSVFISSIRTLVIRIPLLPGSISNFKLAASFNGLNTVIFSDHYKDQKSYVSVSSYSFKFFMEGLYIAVIYISAYLLFFFISFRRNDS